MHFSNWRANWTGGQRGIKKLNAWIVNGRERAYHKSVSAGRLALPGLAESWASQRAAAERSRNRAQAAADRRGSGRLYGLVAKGGLGESQAIFPNGHAHFALGRLKAGQPGGGPATGALFRRELPVQGRLGVREKGAEMPVQQANCTESRHLLLEASGSGVLRLHDADAKQGLAWSLPIKDDEVTSPIHIYWQGVAAKVGKVAHS